MPQTPLDNLNEYIRGCHSSHTDLVNYNTLCTLIHIDIVQESAYRVTINAYKQYYKTRPLPSSESVKRAKAIEEIGLHPLFGLIRFSTLLHCSMSLTHHSTADRIDDNDKMRIEYVKGLKKFRPPQTGTRV